MCVKAAAKVQIIFRLTKYFAYFFTFLPFYLFTFLPLYSFFTFYHDCLRVRFLVNQVQDMVLHQLVVRQQQVGSQENSTQSGMARSQLMQEPFKKLRNPLHISTVICLFARVLFRQKS